MNDKVKDAIMPEIRDGCPLCSGDCGAANPPVINCPMRSGFTDSLGPIKVDEDDRARRLRVIRQAMRETGDYHLKLAAELAEIDALLRLQRLLKL